MVFGAVPVFMVNDVNYIPTFPAVFFYFIMGGVSGLLASLTSKLLYLLEDLWEKTKVPWMWWPGIFFGETYHRLMLTKLLEQS